MTNALIAILVGIVCAICIWAFVLVLQSEPKPPTDEEVAEAEARLRTELAKTASGGGAVVGVTEVSQIRLIPFPRLLPGFEVSPHWFAGIAGIIGACLLQCSLLWCLFVQRTIAEYTQWTDTSFDPSPETLPIKLQNKDGTFEEFDFTEPSDLKTKASEEAH